MLKAIRKLFAYAPRPGLPTRKVLLADLRKASANAGIEPPNEISLGRMTRLDLLAATKALRTTPAAARSAAAAAASREPQPSAAALNGESRPAPTTESEIYAAALADARRDGGTDSQARADAATAVEQFRARLAGQRQTKPTIPTGQTTQTRKPMSLPNIHSAETKPSVPPLPVHQSLTVEESRALNTPPQAPEPIAPWGSVQWSEQWSRYIDTLPPPAAAALAQRSPTFALDERTARAVLAWERSRQEILARLKA